MSQKQIQLTDRRIGNKNVIFYDVELGYRDVSRVAPVVLLSP